MAKEVVAFTWCDPHMADDEQVVGRSFQISINGAKPIEVDLCEVHEKEFLTPLLTLLEESGQPVQDTPVPGAKAKPFTCPECGRGLSTRDSLKGHLKSKHDKEITDPIVEPAGVELKYPCPDCERRFETPQGRGAHRTQVHGYVSPTRVATDAAPAKKTASKRAAKNDSQQESIVDA